jgi:intracellular sulfur oxidation DsrE/DsrF family protein
MLKSVLSAALVAATLPLSAAVSAETTAKPALVTVLAAPDAQTQMMAMVLTMQSVNQGSKARILLCGPAADLALKEAPASATTPQKPLGVGPQDLMRKLMSQGTPVEVCAIYLPNRDSGPDVLLDGVSVAEPPVVAGHLLAENARILSF